MKTFEQLAEDVRVWASNRQILENSTASTELEYVNDEIELAMHAMAYDSEHEVSNAYGHMLAFIITSACIAGIDPVEALASACNQMGE